MQGLGGVVLAGGRSRRMGADKARLPFGGSTLLQRVVGRVAAACAPVVVVASRPDAYEDLGISAVADRFPGYGPLGGLAVGLANVPTPCAAVVACDLPFVRPELLRALADLLGEADCAVPWTDRPQPLCAVYRREVSRAAFALVEAGRPSLRELLRRVRVRFVTAEHLQRWDPALWSFWNVNTPEDYARALAVLASEGGQTRSSPL